MWIAEYLILASNPIPILSNDTSYCENEIFSDMTATGLGGVVNWYSDNSLTNLIGNGNLYTPVNSPGLISYYVKLCKIIYLVRMFSK